MKAETENEVMCTRNVTPKKIVKPQVQLPAFWKTFKTFQDKKAHVKI